VNIWSHLLGFLYFLWLLVENIREAQPHIRNIGDRAAVSLQLITYQVRIFILNKLFDHINPEDSIINYHAGRNCHQHDAAPQNKTQSLMQCL
jgi:hypothetical protein